MRSRTWWFLGCLAAAGCGDAPVTGAPDACLEIAAQCLVNQQGCLADSAGPRCVPCAAGSYADGSGACAPITGAPLTHAFADFTTSAGEEILGLCQSWTLGNETELWVNAVELVQGESSHHSNWTFVPSDHFEGPDGVWDCDERNYNQLSAALAGGVLYAQSTQAAKEVQKFPNRAAVRIPPYSRIIGDVHVLNTTAAPVTGHAELTIYTLPAEEVGVKLAPFHFSYDALDIPPLSTSRFTGECALDETFQNVTEGPLDMILYYSLPHTHAQGRRVFLEVIGGPNDGQSLLDVSGFNGEARGIAYATPVDLAGATGFRFGCEFENPRQESIGWGFGDQEMCEMLGFAEAEIAFESRIESTVSAGTEGPMQLFTGPCNTIGFKWEDRPGGPPP